MPRLTTFASVVLSIVALSCAGSDGGGSTPDPDQGQTITAAITAAGGGTLATPSGGASLTIPGGALAVDTTLSVTVGAAENGSGSSVYEFGPTGTTFLTPVTLSIGFDGAVGADQKAALAWWDGSKWAEVAGSSLSGGKLTGPIGHFSKFTVIVVNGQAVITSACTDTAANFVACGGDPSGVWGFQDVCFVGGIPVGSGGVSEFCAEATTDVDVTWDGTITFSGGQATIAMNSTTTVVTMKIPTSCFSKQPGMTCDLLAQSSEDMACTDNGSSCECSQSQVDSTAKNNDMGAYSVVGNAIVFTGSDGKQSTNDFCQTGDTAVVELNQKKSDGTSQVLYLVLKRK